MRIQIAVALIAFLLLRALQQITKDAHGFLELVRLVRANLMHRKDPTRRQKSPASPAARLNQLQLCSSPTCEFWTAVSAMRLTIHGTVSWIVRWP